MKILEQNKEIIHPSKSEKNATWILHRMHQRDGDAGGIFSIVTGAQGSGKTSILLSFCVYTMKHYPNEKIFWSSCYDAPLQFTKLLKNSINIMVLEGSNITFHDRNDHLKQVYPNITYFKDIDDLWNKSKSGKVNCVFFGNRLMWMSFIHYLRSVGEWVSVYIDELSEVAPSHTSGKDWKNGLMFSIDLKEVRKCMINVHTNTQSTQDIDWRILTKVMCSIFLPGAIANKHSRVRQDAIDNLYEDTVNGNESYIEYSGKFGRTIFKDIFKPTTISWEAKVNV